MAGNRPLSNDAEVISEGRQRTFKDVDAPVREQIVKKLYTKLNDLDIGQSVSNVWQLGGADRVAFLQRQRDFLIEWDEFMAPVYKAGTDWGSALHLPTSMTVAKTYHARMQAALIGVNPPFNVKANKGVFADRAMLVQDLMKYTLYNWLNKYEGFDDFVDRWVWDWITTGVGIAKVSWETEYTRFMDVEKKKIASGYTSIGGQNPETGEDLVQPNMVEKEVEVERTKKVCDGPMLTRVTVEDLLIVGGEGDPQKAEYVIEQGYPTASELWQLVDQKIFDNDAVTEIIRAGANYRSSTINNQIKTERAQGAGEATLDKTYEQEKYHVLECYLQVDVDGSGIKSEIVCWIHFPTRKLLGATYLYRRMPEGRRPYYKIDFYKRTGATYGAGVVELMYSLSKEIDAVHNIRMDVGILCSQPFGFYRPTNSMAEVQLPIIPGTMLPIDNPQGDVFFPQLGNKTAFGFQEEAALNEIVNRFMSVNDITYGSLGSQGATRTATGTRAIQQETNANLDVFIRRMHLGWKGILNHIFELVQLKMDPGFTFRITGDDGEDMWKTINNPDEIKGSYDFVLEPNSASSNSQVQMDNAQQVYQMTSNPIDLQLGIFTPVERYEAIKAVMQAMGVKNYSRFVRKPNGTHKYTPQEYADGILAGINMPLDPTQDLQGIVDYIQFHFDHDELMGHYNNQQAVALRKGQMQAENMLQGMQSQQGQAANQAQQQANAQQANSMSANSAPMAQGAPVAAPPGFGAKVPGVFDQGGVE